MRALVGRALFWIAVLIGSAQAQPALRVLQTLVVWPRIEIAVEKYCAGVLDTSRLTGAISVSEFGLAVDSLVVSTRGDSCPTALALALILDGNRMQGTRFEDARAGCMQFLDGLDGLCDRASVNQYDQNIRKSMATIRSIDSLRTVLGSLSMGGGSGPRLDAIHAAILDLAQHTQARARAILVTASSSDVGSTHKLGEITALARLHRVRIFTIGSGGGAPLTELSALASQTGGEMYSAYDRDQFLSVFAHSYAALRRYTRSTIITYSSHCADGLVREVVLRADSVCGSTAEEYAWYSPALDGNDQQSVVSVVADRKASAGGRSVVRISLAPPLRRTVLHTVEFRIEYDTSLARLDSVTTPPESPLGGKPLRHRPDVHGSIVDIEKRGWLPESSAPVPLLDCHFTSTPRADTGMAVPVRVSHWTFEKGCLQVRDTIAVVSLTRRAPVVVSTRRDSIALPWDTASGTYTPVPCVVKYRVQNIGASPARLVSVFLAYDATTFVHADGDSAWNLSSTILADGSTDIECRMQTLPGSRSGIHVVRLALVFEHGDTMYCDAVLRLMPLGPLVELHEAAVTLDRVEIRYRVYCDGNRQYTAEGSVHVRVDGKIAAVTSISCPGGDADCILFCEDPCPDGGVDTIDVIFDPLCASSAIATVILAGVDLPWPIRVAGKLHLCPGESTELDMGDEAVEYQWDTGERTRRLTVATAGTYGGTLRFADGCRRRTEPVIITASRRPRLTPGGTIVLCPNGIETVGTGKRHAEYKWSTDETTPVIEVKKSGMYHVRVKDTSGCELESDTLYVIANTPIVPRIQPDGPIYLQFGGSQTLVVDQGYAVYTWNTGSQSDRITVTKSGTYYADVTPWGGGCSARTQYVQVHMATSVTQYPDKSDELVVFPDPAASFVTLQMNDAAERAMEYRIVDALGREQDSGLVQGPVRIDLHAWPRGVYTAIIHHAHSLKTKRFLVQ